MDIAFSSFIKPQVKVKLIFAKWKKFFFFNKTNLFHEFTIRTTLQLGTMETVGFDDFPL